MAFGLFFGARGTRGQTQQPFLFATTQVNGNPAVATFTRNDATGTVAEVAGSPFVLFTAGCYPAAMDPRGRFLFGSCGDGISLYSFNSSTGTVAEVPNSPFAASTGGAPIVVIAESTGQFAYALRIARTSFPAPSSATLDSFTIDATNNLLSQPSTQTFTLPGTFLAVVTDPNFHFIQIFLAEPNDPNPRLGGSCAILFDVHSGLPVNSGSGICQRGAIAGENPVGISIDGRGTFLGTSANGQIFSSVDVDAISPTDGTLQAEGNFTFMATNDNVGTPAFDPTGQLLYVPTQQTGLRIFGLNVAQSTVTITELPSSPFPANLDSSPINALPNPAADFTYIGGSNVITAYPIDTTTGYPGAAIASTFSHSPALNFQPVLATLPPPGQAVSAPAVSINTQSLSFGPINSGQMSGPQTVNITSTGNQALTISSIAISPSGGPFSETDSCMTHPVLAPGTFCQVFVSYAPTSAGTSQASLMITDNAAGSPQTVGLSGTALTPPPPAPEVTLAPGTLNFPGTTTQGGSSAPQSIGITNSGNATLTFSSAPVLNGVNTADFSISSNACTGSLAANASCSVTIIFSPLAAGVRTTNLVITDNAVNSPQSITINGSANAAAIITAQAGSSMSASVSAGQPAVFNLQATPGAGFSGTLAFTCSSLPMAASCNAPNVMVASGAAANFSVTIVTKGSAALLPRNPPGIFVWPEAIGVIAGLLLAMLAGWFYLGARRLRADPPYALTWKRAVALACLALALDACGGAGSTSQLSQVITPAGTYTIGVTPSATATGSAKNLSLAPFSLTLIVK